MNWIFEVVEGFSRRKRVVVLSDFAVLQQRGDQGQHDASGADQRDNEAVIRNPMTRQAHAGAITTQFVGGPVVRLEVQWK
jgi:hypothetical protein